MLLALAVAIGLAGTGAPALGAPKRLAAEAALYVRLNGQCDGQLETETCVSHPRSARVRSLRCSPSGEAGWDCRYRRKIHYICAYCKIKWHDARTTFTFDTVAGSWRVTNDTDI